MRDFFQSLIWNIINIFEERYKTEHLKVHRGIGEKYEEYYTNSILCDVLYISLVIGVLMEIFILMFPVDLNSIIFKIPLFKYLFEMEFLDILISLIIAFIMMDENTGANSILEFNLSGFIYIPIILLGLYRLISTKSMNTLSLKSVGAILIISCIIAIPFIILLF